MEDNRINKEERKLWSNFRKMTPKSNTPCPDDSALMAYLEGRCRSGQMSSIEEHLAACPVCLDQMMEMRSLLAIKIEEIPVGIKQKAKDLVNEETWVLDKGGIFSWERVFQLKNSLAWGVVMLLIFGSCFTGIKFGEEAAFSSVVGIFSGQSHDSIGTSVDLLGV